MPKNSDRRSARAHLDIILRDMWQSMPNVDEVFVVAEGGDESTREGKIDKMLLSELVSDTDQPFYICGPQEMVDDVRAALKDSGVADKKIITEDGW